MAALLRRRLHRRRAVVVRRVSAVVRACLAVWDAMRACGLGGRCQPVGSAEGRVGGSGRSVGAGSVGGSWGNGGTLQESRKKQCTRPDSFDFDFVFDVVRVSLFPSHLPQLPLAGWLQKRTCLSRRTAYDVRS